MGKVVTVMNMKGGVGKTTVAIHLSGLVARYEISGKRRKVLLIDYDPQFNASQAFIPPKSYFELEKSGKTVLSILTEDDENLNPYHIQVPGNEVPPEIDAVIQHIYGYEGVCLDMIPSTLDLMYVALGQSEKSTRPIEERFHRFITNCRNQYDLIVIDCHPAGSILTKTSLHNSDHVVIPVVTQSYAVRGIGLMMKFIEAKKQGTIGPTPHILFNLTSRTGGMSEEENVIRNDPQFRDYCFVKSLHRYKAFSDPKGGNGFTWNTGKPWGYEAFYNLHEVATEFLERIEQEVSP